MIQMSDDLLCHVALVAMAITTTMVAMATEINVPVA